MSLSRRDAMKKKNGLLHNGMNSKTAFLGCKVIHKFLEIYVNQKPRVLDSIGAELEFLCSENHVWKSCKTTPPKLVFIGK